VQILHVLTELEFSGQISVNIPNTKFNRIPSCGRRVVSCRRTGRRWLQCEGVNCSACSGTTECPGTLGLWPSKRLMLCHFTEFEHRAVNLCILVCL